MKRTLVPIALAAFVLALAAAPAGAAPRPKTVKLLDLASFDPSFLTIRQGTLVRFNWVGVMTHDVTKSKRPGKVLPVGGAGVRPRRHSTSAGSEAGQIQAHLHRSRSGHEDEACG